MQIPEGFTDDMTVKIGAGRTADELVTKVMDWLVVQRDLVPLITVLEQDFGLSEDDAILALDRVQGGIVRALTGNSSNMPNMRKDPLAWISFTKVWDELPRRHFFSGHKKAAGRWNEWFRTQLSSPPNPK